MKKFALLLVADSSQAKIFSFINRTKINKVEFLREFSCEESRKNNIELSADKGGHFNVGTFVEKTDPKETATVYFAQEISRWLEMLRHENRLSELIVVAPPHFLGLLNQSFSKELMKLVKHTVAKDYAKDATQTLIEHLRHSFNQ